MGKEKRGWFKENGATIVSIISVLLSASIVYSSNDSLKEKYAMEQYIERQRVAVEYYKWWQKEFNSYATEYLTALDVLRANNTKMMIIASNDKSAGRLFRQEFQNINDTQRVKLQRAHYNLVCLLDDDNDFHRNFLRFLEQMYNVILHEAQMAMRGERFERDGELESVYFRLLNEIRDDSFEKLGLLYQFQSHRVNEFSLSDVKKPLPEYIN